MVYQLYTESIYNLALLSSRATHDTRSDTRYVERHTKRHTIFCAIHEATRLNVPRNIARVGSPKGDISW
ncbi:hypothetical protein DPMN_059704 [Dreissena polymorpha]|uniref:Uncharacterized protein n=1 Tax=Dreissena polymorpha TaxID=45954 RepID=A0A9D4C4M1_DREPO|nr:hypothetical protein DPMN_059704 [Dreissena polymorpha]